jgi:protease-4
LFAFVIGLGLLAWIFLQRGPTVERGTVLVLDVREALPERAEVGLQALLGAPVMDFLELAGALRRAARDDRVEGLLLKVSSGGLGAGMAEELRESLSRFRLSGKFVIAYASGPSTLQYFLATAADEILIDESTTLDTTGIRLNAFFLKDALSELGVEPDLVRVGDFKGMFEELAFSAPTTEFEETMSSLADSLYETIVEGVATSRKLDGGSVRALFDRCPLRPDEAKREKLVDDVVDAASVLKRIEARAGKTVHLARIEDYLKAGSERFSSEKWFAVVHVVGAIVEGDSRELPLTGLSTGAESLARALKKAAEDPGAAGILLRIDSPGGSASASEKIFRAVEAARKRKPVVVSMGDTAASGGYYAACAADRIFGLRMTLTGSIGVFGGKVVLKDLLQRHHVELRSYGRGKHAGMNDFARPFTADERLLLKELLEDCYRRFIARVAAGRKKSLEDINSVAQGRVWTGRAALEKGLVDALGGMAEAIEALRELARVPPDTSLDLHLYPPRATLWDLFGKPQESDLVFAPPLRARALPIGSAGAWKEVRAWLRESSLFDGRASLALMPIVLEVK